MLLNLSFISYYLLRHFRGLRVVIQEDILKSLDPSFTFGEGGYRISLYYNRQYLTDVYSDSHLQPRSPQILTYG